MSTAERRDLPHSLGDLLEDLKLLIRSRYGLIFLRTRERDRARSLLRHLADQLSRPLFTWSRAAGLRRIDADNAVYNTDTLQGALRHVANSRQSSIYKLRVRADRVHFMDPNPKKENSTRSEEPALT